MKKTEDEAPRFEIMAFETREDIMLASLELVDTDDGGGGSMDFDDIFGI